MSIDGLEAPNVQAKTICETWWRGSFILRQMVRTTMQAAQAAAAGTTQLSRHKMQGHAQQQPLLSRVSARCSSEIQESNAEIDFVILAIPAYPALVLQDLFSLKAIYGRTFSVTVWTPPCCLTRSASHAYWFWLHQHLNNVPLFRQYCNINELANLRQLLGCLILPWKPVNWVDVVCK